MNNELKNNILKILCGNIMIIVSGIVVSFLLPKILGVTDYGYYKIFNLYTTYVVFFDLGITNGVYLVFGGNKLEELPTRRMRLYFRVLFVIQCVAFGIMQIITIVFLKNEYRFIFSMLGFYLLANNITNYFEKVSVMSGEFTALVKRDALKSIMSVVIVMILFLAIKINVPVKYFKLYIILFVVMYFLLALQYVGIYKNLVFGQTSKFINEKSDMIYIIKIGMTLLFADMIASLIFTLDRQFVSLLCDIDTYSNYSFAYSMLKIVTLAITAISSVIYPTLKRMGVNEMKKSYGFSISIVGMIAFVCLLGYYPLCLIVEHFLPNYMTSLPIFRMLFPSITINSIISMIVLNHYKALQKQNLYFVISVIVFGLAVVFNVIVSVLFENPIGFAVASVITMMVWYYISDSYLRKNTKSEHKNIFCIFW